MLARINRFTTKLFDRLFRRSKRFRAGPCVFLLSPVRGHARCAVVVGKKVSKKAVTRNRLRRQAYEILRTQWIPRNPNQNLICLYSPREIPENAQVFEQSLHKLIDSLA